MKKTVVILQHNGGELSNQLWNFISIYAYCLEKGYKCQNHSFFEYDSWFQIPVYNQLIYALFFIPFRVLRLIFPFRVARKIARVWYGLYVCWIRFAEKEHLVSVQNQNEPFYLSPTQGRQKGSEKIVQLEQNEKVKTIYFDGWLFRNPVGIKKYRKQILDYFQPQAHFVKRAYEFTESLRGQYDYLVGVHIRQRKPGDTSWSKERDLREWEQMDAKSFFYEEHLGFVRSFLEEYLKEFKKNRERTCFILFSTNKMNFEKYFSGLHIVFSGGNPIEDILTMSCCDVIIGSNTSFSPLASYWGDIPLIVFQKNPDWSYYKDKKGYFENKYVSGGAFLI